MEYLDTLSIDLNFDERFDIAPKGQLFLGKNPFAKLSSIEKIPTFKSETSSKDLSEIEA
jgi:hypothetical protein